MTEIELIEKRADEFRTLLGDIKRGIGQVIVGQQAVISDVLKAVFGGGHVLLEGAPGLGKTRLMLTLSDILGLTFGRIQFTPDLMPADIIGTRILIDGGDGGKRFEFQKGPLFANIVLADEINRATPKTQSALLEAMQEGAVTIAGKRYLLPTPFFVLATQNPIEMEGTYPLPEAQLDRFMLKVNMTIGSSADLTGILTRTTSGEQVVPETSPAAGRMSEFIELVRSVTASQTVLSFAANAVLMTHPDHENAPDIVKRYVRYGASPRGAQAMVIAAKVAALEDGRYNISTEDIKAAAHASLRHRIILGFEGLTAGASTDAIIQSVLDAARSDVFE